MVSNHITSALRQARTPLPEGFSFRVMQRVRREQLLRAETTTRRQLQLVQIGLIALAVLVLLAFKWIGLSSLAWLHSLPMLEITGLFCGWVGITLLDQLIPRWLSKGTSSSLS